MTSTVWRPCASISNLRKRAEVIARIRRFFADREVLEVETPLLGRYAVTDPHMDLLTADNPVGLKERYYLQTSPEYAMKRLLAAGSGAIYQLCKAFRRGEVGRRHNPEFTLLEWYRPGFDHWRLMDEISDLIVLITGCLRPLRVSYRTIFEQHLGIDPHVISCDELESLARSQLDIQMDSSCRDDWLNLLLAEVIEPQLGFEAPVFLFDYPESQAALAKVSEDEKGVLVGRRFELYIRGVELANGYMELTDEDILRRRFAADRQLRKELSRPDVASDASLLAAMKEGLPECAGVALGVDRLLMVALELDHIDQVITFSSDRA